jgi:hypothetical protein
VARGRDDTEPVVLAAAAELAAWCAGQAGVMAGLVTSVRLVGLGSRSTTQTARERMIYDRLLSGRDNAVAGASSRRSRWCAQ